MQMFFFGFLLGMLVAIAVMVLLVFFTLRGASRESAARILHGIAMSLAHKSKPGPPAPARELLPDSKPKRAKLV